MNGADRLYHRFGDSIGRDGPGIPIYVIHYKNPDIAEHADIFEAF